MLINPWEQKNVENHSILLNNSFFYWTKKYLINPVPPAQDLARLFYTAPFVLVSHGIEADPVFNYANKTAQDLWKFTWEEFIKTPSRLSADPTALVNRSELFEKADQQGFAGNYSGIRITKNKRKFLMKDAILWKVIDENGHNYGHAAVFWDWELI